MYFQQSSSADRHVQPWHWLFLRSVLKTCDNTGAEDPLAAAAVSEMKDKLMELLPSEWKEDCRLSVKGEGGDQ